jgi:hypothetical protein
MLNVIYLQGLVAQTNKGAKWTARMPPKRQVEGSNPSEPGGILHINYSQHAFFMKFIEEIIYIRSFYYQ